MTLPIPKGKAGKEFGTAVTKIPTDIKLWPARLVQRICVVGFCIGVLRIQSASKCARPLTHMGSVLGFHNSYKHGLSGLACLAWNRITWYSLIQTFLRSAIWRHILCSLFFQTYILIWPCNAQLHAHSPALQMQRKTARVAMLAACGNSNAAGQKVRAPLEGIAFGSLELEMSSTTPRGPMPHYDTMPPKKRQLNRLQLSMSLNQSGGPVACCFHKTDSRHSSVVWIWPNLGIWLGCSQRYLPTESLALKSLGLDCNLGFISIQCRAVKAYCSLPMQKVLTNQKSGSCRSRAPQNHTTIQLKSMSRKIQKQYLIDLSRAPRQ